MRGKIARNELNFRRERKNKVIKETDQAEAKILKLEKVITDTRSNINEQRPKGLRQKLKDLQTKRSELTTRGPVNLSRDEKKEQVKKLTGEIEHYENVIIKQKPGPKVKGIIDQFGVAAFTPKKK